MLASPTETWMTSSRTFSVPFQDSELPLQCRRGYGGVESREWVDANSTGSQTRTEEKTFEMQVLLDQETYELTQGAFSVESGAVEYLHHEGSHWARKSSYQPKSSKNFTFYIPPFRPDSTEIKLFFKTQAYPGIETQVPSLWTIVSVYHPVELKESVDGVTFKISTEDIRHPLNQKISVEPLFYRLPK